MSRGPMCFKIYIFLNKILRKLGKKKIFIFENFQECQFQNAVESWVLGAFESGFRGSMEEHVKKTAVP